MNKKLKRNENEGEKGKILVLNKVFVRLRFLQVNTNCTLLVRNFDTIEEFQILFTIPVLLHQ